MCAPIYTCYRPLASLLSTLLCSLRLDLNNAAPKRSRQTNFVWLKANKALKCKKVFWSYIRPVRPNYIIFILYVYIYIYIYVYTYVYTYKLSHVVVLPQLLAFKPQTTWTNLVDKVESKNLEEHTMILVSSDLRYSKLPANTTIRLWYNA